MWMVSYRWSGLWVGWVKMVWVTESWGDGCEHYKFHTSMWAGSVSDLWLYMPVRVWGSFTGSESIISCRGERVVLGLVALLPLLQITKTL